MRRIHSTKIKVEPKHGTSRKAEQKPHGKAAGPCRDVHHIPLDAACGIPGYVHHAPAARLGVGE